MKRNLFSVFASLVFAGTLVAAQASQEPASQPPSPGAPTPQAPAAASPSQSQDSDDETLKGCLIEGSSPNVYILDNATEATAPSGTKGQRYVVEISAPADQLKQVMNTHVQIVGVAKEKASDASPSSPAPAGQSPSASASAADSQSSEANLPRLTAKRITRLAETCPAPSGD